MFLNNEYILELFEEQYDENEYSLEFITDENTNTSLIEIGQYMLDNTNFNETAFMNTQQTTQTSNIKRGRKRDSNSSNPVHTKNTIDNKIRKIRIHGITFGMKLINDCITFQYPNSNLALKGISREITSDINIYFILDFFEYTLEQIYSNPLNSKYKRQDPNSNIKVIEELKKKNNHVINKLLNMKFKELFNLFVESDKDKLKIEYGLKEAKTFEDLIDKLKNEDEDYKKDLKYVANNFLDYFEEKKARFSEKRQNKLVNTNFSNCRKKSKCEKG